MTGRLVRKILIGASTAGLNIAGVAALGPAWPIVSGALAPVLELLTEKLGGANPTGSPEAAARAADAFDADPRLEELLRSNLEQALAPLVAGQQRLDASLQVVCQMVMENSRDLEEITRSVGAIGDRLDAGVTLTDEAFERLADATAERVAVTLEVARFARREDGVEAAAWITRDELLAEVDRAEVEAVGRIEAGHADEAMATLGRARGRLAHALTETPSDVHLRLSLGYLHKATAQASQQLGDEGVAEAHLRDAERLFGLIVRDAPADSGTQADIASALNGLANVLAERGQHAEAVRLYRDAVRMVPGYGYAWHDLFASLAALAAAGDVRPRELDDAWQGLAATAPGYPGLEPARLEELRSYYERYRVSGQSHGLGA